MKTILRALAAASISAILAAPAQAQLPVVTMTMSGTIVSGRDDLSLFVENVGGWYDIDWSLDDLPFTMSFTIDPNTLDVIESSDSRTYLYKEGKRTTRLDTGAHYRGEVTVNGKTYAWNSQAGEGSVELIRGVGATGEPEDRIWIWGTGFDANGIWINAASLMVYSSGVRLLDSVALEQDLIFPLATAGISANAQFFVRASHDDLADYSTRFHSGQNPYTFRLTSATWHVSPVPEPGQYAMLAVGLCALVVARRRRSQSRCLMSEI
jgi:hypothetical protein